MCLYSYSLKLLYRQQVYSVKYPVDKPWPSRPVHMYIVRGSTENGRTQCLRVPSAPPLPLHRLCDKTYVNAYFLKYV
jgi:hypothetical protein